MPGEDDELRIDASLTGDLEEALRRVEQRLDRVESGLESAGRSGERAGNQIESGANDAAEALRRTESAAEGAADELDDLQRRAEQSARQMRAMTQEGARAAGALESVEGAAESAEEALHDTERAARGAGRALDDAGDEAAEAGAQAAASATGWEKLWRAIDRNERISRRFAAAQDMLRWDAWAARADRFQARVRAVIDLDWGGGARKVRALSKSFASFGQILGGLKIMAVAGALHFLLGLVSALGAGAVGAVGGIGSMAAGLAAIVPLIGAAAAAMIAFRVAAEPLKDELDRLKSRFDGVGNAIANGGLRSGLDFLDSRIGKFAENVESGMAIVGGALGKSVRDVAEYISQYKTLQNMGTVWVGLGGIISQFGILASHAFNIFINFLRASMPAAGRLTTDLVAAAGALDRWLERVTDSGQAAAFISASYDRLRRGVIVLKDLTVGLFRIFRIGAQEARWMGTSIEEAARRFNAWTASAEGQNAIRQWFQDAMPAVRETLLLLRDVAVWLGNLSTSDGLAPLINQIRTQVLPAVGELLMKLTGQGGLGPALLQAFTEITRLFAQLDLTALTMIVTGVAQFVGWLSRMVAEVPGVGVLVSTLLTLWAVGGVALKVIAGGMAAFGWVTSAIGLTGKLSLAQQALGYAVLGVRNAVGWVRTAFLALTGAQTVMGGVAVAARLMWAAITGPIGLIVLGITAVVAAFIWAYNNVEWFRTAVDTAVRWVVDTFWWAVDGIVAAWGQVGTWLSEQWNGWIKPTLDAIVFVLKIIGAVIFTVLVAPWVIAWNMLSAAASWAWSWLEPIFTWIGEKLGWLGTIVQLAIGFIVAKFQEWQAAAAERGAQIQAILQMIGDWFNWLWTTYVQPVINWIIERWNFMILGMQIAYESILLPLLNGIGTALNWLWTNIVQPVLNFILTAWNNLMWGLSLAKTTILDPMLAGIQTALSVLQGWFQGAVDGVATAWNGLRRATAVPVNFLINTVWNNGILKVWNWVAEKIGLPTGSPVATIPEFAHGGHVRGPGTGTSDSIPAMLSNGEHVWTAEEVRRAGGHQNMLNLRAMARAGAIPQFATGGPVVDTAGDQPAPPGGGLLGGLAAWAWSWAKPILNGIIDPVINSIPFSAPPTFLDIPKRAAITAKDAFFIWAEKKMNEWGMTAGAGGPLGMGGGGGGVGWMMSVLRAVFPGLALISGLRPGAITATGNRSYHSMGRAVDVPPRMDVFNWIRANFGGRTRELIFSPAGGAQVHNGRPHMYTGITRANHWDHVHWAFDEGGYLPTGITPVFNGTGKPEPVFTSAQWDQLNPANLVEAMHTTAPSLEARAASDREDALIAAISGLVSAIDERPPAISASGDETKRAVKAALAERDRERELKSRYRY